MSSINFNAAATQALRTLQTSNSQLDATQNRISTGLKISEAKDNAAYWSISTTMQSDNKALSTVTDALGLGAATVDTAYQGLSAAKDVLDEIKSKLTAALGSNVDRTAIQAEIDSLQEQLKSIASSSTFSGENWLSVNSSLSTYSAGKTVVSSFTRDVSGNVKVGEIKFDSSTAVLFDASSEAAATGKGILDSKVGLKDSKGNDLKFGGSDVTSGNLLTGGLKTTASTDDGAAAGSAVTTTVLGGATSSSKTYSFASGISPSANALVAGNVVTVSFGGSDSVAITVTAGMVTAGKITTADILAGTQSLTTISLSAGTTPTDLVVKNISTGTTPAPSISGIVTTRGTDPGSATLATFATPSAPTGAAVVTGAASTEAVVETGNLTVGDFAEGDKLKLTVLNGATSATYETDALGASPSLNDIRDALNAKFTAATAGITASINGSKLVLTADATTTAKAAFSITGAALTSAGGAAKVATNLPITAPAVVTTDNFAVLTLDDDDNLNFDVTVGAAVTATAVKIDKALVDKALKDVAGHVSGKISSADDMVLVVKAALTAANVSGVNVEKSGTALTFSTVATGAAAKLSVSAVTVSQGADQISVDNMDISDAALTAVGADTADKRVQAITAYINVVNAAINKVTAAATSIGSIGKRIDLQQTFVQKLMDTIEKGVSGLIDADMNEESTKLQALQVKQQLGVQALSIANQSAQNVLSLFRG